MDLHAVGHQIHNNTDTRKSLPYLKDLKCWKALDITMQRMHSYKSLMARAGAHLMFVLKDAGTMLRWRVLKPCCFTIASTSSRESSMESSSPGKYV